MREKTISQILCRQLEMTDGVTFMPEVWREGCGAVFLSGERKNENGVSSVDFELALRCGDTAAERNLAILRLEQAGEYLSSSVTDVEGHSGYVTLITGPRLTEVYKNGEAEYRGKYRLSHSSTTAKGEDELQYYINIGEKSSPEWSRISGGFPRFSEEMISDTDERRYYHEKVRRVELISCSSAIGFELQLSSASPAAEYLMKKCDGESIGKEAEVEILTVTAVRESAQGALPAVYRQYTAVGNGYVKSNGILCLSGRLMGCGVTERGRFVLSTGTFIK